MIEFISYLLESSMVGIVSWLIARILTPSSRAMPMAVMVGPALVHLIVLLKRGGGTY